jgi:hypothetical protein
MDPNKKPGSNWPKLKPPDKVEILIRYREKCLERKDFRDKADDFFYTQVLNEGLENVLIQGVSDGTLIFR